MYCTNLTIEFGSQKESKVFLESIKPELKEKFLRSKASIKLKKNVLEIRIRALDKTAMRASLNSFAKPLMLFEKLEEII